MEKGSPSIQQSLSTVGTQLEFNLDRGEKGGNPPHIDIVEQGEDAEERPSKRPKVPCARLRPSPTALVAAPNASPRSSLRRPASRALGRRPGQIGARPAAAMRRLQALRAPHAGRSR